MWEQSFGNLGPQSLLMAIEGKGKILESMGHVQAGGESGCSGLTGQVIFFLVIIYKMGKMLAPTWWAIVGKM